MKLSMDGNRCVTQTCRQAEEKAVELKGGDKDSLEACGQVYWPAEREQIS